MRTQEYAQRYAAAQVTVVDRERLLLLVFEGGLKFLRLTRAALAAGDLRGFSESLGRAQAIVAELRATLDFAGGAEIAANLARLYDFMLFHLTEANTQKSVRHVDEVLAVFATIGDAYRTILERGAAAVAAAPSTATAG
jgi:flagellar secretion chaperone FliS